MAVPWKKIVKWPLLLLIAVAKEASKDLDRLLGKAEDDVSKWQKKKGIDL